MGGFQNNLGCHSGIVGVLPPTGTQAPFVARFKSRKFVFRARGAEVISLLSGKFQELICHDGANGVNPRVTLSGVAVAISVVSR